MITTKIIETSVDLFNPSDIYRYDITPTIIKILEKRYVGHCFKAMLITRIVRIINNFDVVMVCNRLDGAGQVDVQVEVEGHVFIPGEILHGCRVIEMRTNMIVAKHEYADIQIAPGNPVLDNLIKIGIDIPVLIRNVRYAVNGTSVSIVGQLFHYIYPASIATTPNRQPAVPEYFLLSGSFDMDDQQRLSDMVEKIQTYQTENEQQIDQGMKYIRCVKQPLEITDSIANIFDVDSIAELPGQRIYTNMEMEGHIMSIADDKECIEYDTTRLVMSMANRLLIRMHGAVGFAAYADKYPKSYLSLLLEQQK